MPAPQSTDYRDSAIQECDKLIKHFDERARRHKRIFMRYKNLSIALTFGVTDISAIQGIYQPTLTWVWVLPVVSDLAAFCTAMVHATNAQELWLRSRSMTHRLTTERFLFLQAAMPRRTMVSVQPSRLKDSSLFQEHLHKSPALQRVI